MANPRRKVVIVGSGPAGIFAAMEIIKRAPGTEITMVEKGPDILHRTCPMLSKGSGCVHCKPCQILCGWGGAGAFSDGKITLTTEYGGFLTDYLERSVLEKHIAYIDRVYQDYGAGGKIYGDDDEKTREFHRLAAMSGLRLLPARIRHLGTEKCPEILLGMRQFVEQHAEIRYRSIVSEITTQNGYATGVRLESGEVLSADYVIAAPGREGAEWFREEGRRLGLRLANNPVDIGVRVEVPAVVTDHLTRHIYEPKLMYYSNSFDDPVRTFCVCPNGRVAVENNSGLLTVNGHSYLDRPTENTNFALLVSKTFTEPFKEPIAYGKYIASLANMLGGGVIVQRLGDLQSGRRSTHKRLEKAMVEPTLKEATPGDISLVLPYRHLINILEMLAAFDKIAPGVNSKHTLLYGVEVKFYSSRPEVDPDLETKIHNLYAIGDGAGVTRSLAQASVSGVVAARSIARKLGFTTQMEEK